MVVVTKKGFHFLYVGRQVLVSCFVHFPRLHASLCVCVITCNVQRRSGIAVVHLASVSSVYSEKSLNQLFMYKSNYQADRNTDDKRDLYLVTNSMHQSP
jgi:hypothetical protein